MLDFFACDSKLVVFIEKQITLYLSLTSCTPLPWWDTKKAMTFSGDRFIFNRY